MPFFVTMRAGDGTERRLGEVPFVSLEEAYLDACAAIPDAAADELSLRRDPFHCAFLIRDAGGALLLEVPFTDLLAPSARAAAPPPAHAVSARTDDRGRADHSAALRAEAREFRDRLAASIRRSKQLVAQSAALALL